ncbi:MAG TPA: hypothetical protein VHD58_00955 [Mycobacteriales bacterium]|nr:hypothetical protein [Mycobacteriales bacterium]
MRVLGVQCTTKHAFLTVVEEGSVIPAGPQRLAAAQSMDEDHALWGTLATFGEALDEVKPDRIALLLPGTGENSKGPHSAWAPRIELETLLRMAAAQRDLPVSRLARATVLARLGLPRKGKFEELVKPVSQPVGDYWAAGRLLAAAAAIAEAN